MMSSVVIIMLTNPNLWWLNFTCTQIHRTKKNSGMQIRKATINICTKSMRLLMLLRIILSRLTLTCCPRRPSFRTLRRNVCNLLGWVFGRILDDSLAMFAWVGIYWRIWLWHNSAAMFARVSCKLHRYVVENDQFLPFVQVRDAQRIRILLRA